VVTGSEIVRESRVVPIMRGGKALAVGGKQSINTEEVRRDPWAFGRNLTEVRRS